MAEPEIVLYFEDVRSVDGRMLSETAWVDPVPLMVMPESESEGHSGAEIIGAVSGIRREGHVVWGTPSIPLESYQGLACEPDFDHVGDPRMVGETMVMSGARLRAVTLGHHPVWPGLEVGVECHPKVGWLSGEEYCAVRGRAGGWPCRFSRRDDA